MTKFKFRLEAALRFRHMRVDAESAKLQQLLGQQKRLENSLAGLQSERTSAAAFVHSVANPAAQDLRALSLFTIGLEARSRTVKEALAEMTELVEEQKKRLLEAERDARSLSKLRAKRFEEWRLHAEREIEATAQELWLFSHTKSKEDL